MSANHDSEQAFRDLQADRRVRDAAPEMLTALKRAEMWLGKMIADSGHNNAVLPWDCVVTLAMVSAAIAKATQP